MTLTTATAGVHTRVFVAADFLAASVSTSAVPAHTVSTSDDPASTVPTGTVPTGTAPTSDVPAGDVPASTVPDVAAAMRRAIELACRGPAAGPNPRVGCVILAPDDGGPRRILGEGYHRGAGTPHAEVDALRDARERASLSKGNQANGATNNRSINNRISASGNARPDSLAITQDAPDLLRGATAIVTLEPCSHTGRTGPCTEALAAAGISEVIYAVDDPNPEAAGGASYLRDRGIRVESGIGREEAFEVVRVWAASLRLGRPYVTLKLATTLDGKIAAEDGTSQWITSTAAREHAHRTRSEVGAILVGTGTVLSDDPSLTARDSDGTALPQQPLRVALGHRQVPMDARMRGNEDEFLYLATRNPAEALAALAEREIRHVLVEGGASVAAAFLEAGLVDELHTYLAPIILGSGKSAVDPFGIETLTDAERWHTEEVRRLGQDTFIRAVKSPAQPSTTKHPGA